MRGSKQYIDSTKRHLIEVDRKLNTSAVLEKLNNVIPDFLYHATPKSNLCSIVDNGLIPCSPRSTFEGASFGVYLSGLKVDEILDYCGDITDPDIVIVKVASPRNNIRLDPEYYGEYLSEGEDYILELLDEPVVVYCTVSIPPESILCAVTIDSNPMRNS